MLQDSLGGNSKTVMCASISPADTNYVETISTLRYAGRAKSIQNRAHVNEEPKDALLRHFQEEIAELKKQLEDGLLDGVSGDDDLDEDDEDDDEDDDMYEENDGPAQEPADNIKNEEETKRKEKKVKDGTLKKGKKRRSNLQKDEEESEKPYAEKELLEQMALENEKELNQAK